MQEMLLLSVSRPEQQKSHHRAVMPSVHVGRTCPRHGPDSRSERLNHLLLGSVGEKKYLHTYSPETQNASSTLIGDPQRRPGSCAPAPFWPSSPGAAPHRLRPTPYIKQVWPRPPSPRKTPRANTLQRVINLPASPVTSVLCFLLVRPWTETGLEKPLLECPSYALDRNVR